MLPKVNLAVENINGSSTKSPNHVIVVGPQRCGTTWIYEYFKRSKRVNLTKFVKETFFFSDNYDQGYAWYLEQFENRYDITLDVSSTYFSDFEAIERISQIEGVRVVICYRTPESRLPSLHRHYVQNHFASRDIDEAVKKYPQIIESNRYCYFYGKWVEAVGEANVHICQYNELRDDPAAFAEKLCDFVGTDFFQDDEIARVVNSGSEKRWPKLSSLKTSVLIILRKAGFGKVIYVFRSAHNMFEPISSGIGCLISPNRSGSSSISSSLSKECDGTEQYHTEKYRAILEKCNRENANFEKCIRKLHRDI